MQGRLFPNDFRKLNLFPTKWKNEFEQLNKIGFDYLELIYDRNQSPINPLIHKKLKHKTLSKIVENKIYSINLDFFTQNNIFKNISSNKKLIKKIIKNSELLKIKLIVIPCIEKNKMNNKELIVFIKILKQLIFKKKISISLEIEKFDQKVLNLLNKKIGICYDTGNMALKSKDYLHKFKNNINKINHIHLKDNYVKKSKRINCRLGDGVVKFDKFFSILKSKKYDGKITLETNLGKKTLLEAKKNLKFIRNFL